MYGICLFHVCWIWLSCEKRPLQIVCSLNEKAIAMIVICWWAFNENWIFDFVDLLKLLVETFRLNRSTWYSLKSRVFFLSSSTLGLSGNVHQSFRRTAPNYALDYTLPSPAHRMDQRTRWNLKEPWMDGLKVRKKILFVIHGRNEGMRWALRLRLDLGIVSFGGFAPMEPPVLAGLSNGRLDCHGSFNWIRREVPGLDWNYSMDLPGLMVPRTCWLSLLCLYLSPPLYK